jgi:hypothetical protein
MRRLSQDNEGGVLFHRLTTLHILADSNSRDVVKRFTRLHGVSLELDGHERSSSKLAFSSMYFILRYPSFAADGDYLATLIRRHRDCITLYVIVPLCIIGLMCDLFIVSVPGRNKTMNAVSRFLMQQLALVNFAFHITCPLHEISRNVGDLSWRQRTALVTVLYISSCISQTTAMWMAVAVTLQRYMAISTPLNVLQYNKMSLARRAVVFVWIGSILVNIPNALNSELGYKLSYSMVVFLMVANFVVVAFLTSWLPISFVAFLNNRTSVVMRISTASQAQQQLSSDDQLVNIERRNVSQAQQQLSSDDQLVNIERRITVRLITILLVLLACHVPSAAFPVIFKITELYGYIVSSLFSITNALLLLHLGLSTSALLLVIKSLATYVTYFFVDKRFR